MNGSETTRQIVKRDSALGDTPVTQPRSWIVRDANGKPWGPFDSAGEATTWAREKWPDIPQQDEVNGSGQVWDVEALWAPV